MTFVFKHIMIIYDILFGCFQKILGNGKEQNPEAIRRPMIMVSRKDKEIFGAYIKNLREKKVFSLDQVCEGLCTSQQLFHVERGEKVISKQLQDALLERLGVGAEDYEQYLSPEDYDRWEMRQRILHRIVWSRTRSARELLREYYFRYAAGSGGRRKGHGQTGAPVLPQHMGADPHTGTGP